MEKRQISTTRKTKETDIQVTLNLDGSGISHIETGIGFFDHMLEGFSKHGFFDLHMECDGDLQVDSHHTIEDCGIVLGDAIKKALGDKSGIKRFGSCILPMDETLVLCAVDLSGGHAHPDQPVLAIRAAFPLTAERFKCGNHAVVADFRRNREPLPIIVVLDLTDGLTVFARSNSSPG